MERTERFKIGDIVVVKTSSWNTPPSPHGRGAGCAGQIVEVLPWSGSANVGFTFPPSQPCYRIRSRRVYLDDESADDYVEIDVYEDWLEHAGSVTEKYWQIIGPYGAATEPDRYGFTLDALERDFDLLTTAELEWESIKPDSIPGSRIWLCLKYKPGEAPIAVQAA